MKRKIWFVGLVILPIMLIILVNETSAPNFQKYDKNKCTRYCHNIKCEHFLKSITEKSISSELLNLYEKNIIWLKKNPLGLSYQEINILTYVVLSPIVLMILLWGIIRKPKLKND